MLWDSNKPVIFTRIIIDPTNPNTIYVGAIGSPWGEHEERGVYKTTDGGKTWSKILFANNKTGVADLVMDPNNPNKLIAALWEHKEILGFLILEEKVQVFISYDGGEHWKKVTSEEGLPDGNLEDWSSMPPISPISFML